MRQRLTALLLILYALPGVAQSGRVTSVRVRGEFSVVLAYADITGREATQRAEEDAKRKALEQVCGSRLSIWEQLESSSAGDSFNSLAVSQTDGEIVEFAIVDEDQQLGRRSAETLFYCVADVKVRQGVAPDPDFAVTVSGLKSVYLAGEPLHFAIRPHRDCYMKLFLFDDNRTGYLLYPNRYDSAQRFVAGTDVDITRSPAYEFYLTKSSSARREVNRLVFLFTKSECPCPFSEQETPRAEIERWIASIPNPQRYLHMALIEIRDN